MLAAALAAGLASEGVAVDRLGVVPTPAVAWLSAAEDVPAAMISASHNPFGDNGIKLFAAGGRKLPDDVEEELEAELDRLLHRAVAVPGDVGAIDERDDVLPRYAEHLQASVGSLAGMRVVLDCANGAASSVAPDVL